MDVRWRILTVYQIALGLNSRRDFDGFSSGSGGVGSRDNCPELRLSINLLVKSEYVGLLLMGLDRRPLTFFGDFGDRRRILGVDDFLGDAAFSLDFGLSSPALLPVSGSLALDLSSGLPGVPGSRSTLRSGLGLRLLALITGVIRSIEFSAFPLLSDALRVSFMFPLAAAARRRLATAGSTHRAPSDGRM